MADRGGKITTREVGRLRREWLTASQGLRELLESFTRFAGIANIGRSADDSLDDTALPRAEIGAAQQQADEARVRYEDARAELQSQQADAQAKATNFLAYVAVAATIVQAAVAVWDHFK